MLVKCKCNHCPAYIEFDSANAGQVIACPTCGIETTLYIPPPPPVPKVKKPAQKFSMKFSPWMIVRLLAVAGIAGFVAYKLSENIKGMNKDMNAWGKEMAKPTWDMTAARKKAMEDGIKGAVEMEAHIRSLENSVANKNTDWPPPPTSGMELSTKLLDNFPERVINQQGWMDGEFLSFDGGDSEFLSKESVGFWIWDKDGDVFEYCFANKAKYGDLLLNLRKGDRIRIIGEAGMLSYDGDGNFTKLFLRADSIEVIK